ncbi:MAG TPA: hypothetical protein VKT26_07300 [Acetobacteraceae bacterium]|nr:hypothetical protein [Acetobacteraceae bacterium]
MRPLPPDKQHGVIHKVRVTKANLDDIAKALELPAKAKKRLRAGRTVHFVREADDDEMKKD